MPITADDGFRELLHRIELNPSRVELATQRYNAIKDSIEAALPGKTVRQIGSFQRKTKIRPADLSDKLDVDVLVSFGKFYQYAPSIAQGVSPSQALQIVQQALQWNQTYRVMPQAADHPSVRLEYFDGMTIELVPAYEDLTGQYSHGPSGPVCFVVGTSPYIWGPADYDFDAQMISYRNSSCDGRLVPIIKIAKAYVRNAGIPLKSFHTEILVANTIPPLISEWKSKAYKYGLQHLLAGFLSQATKIIASPGQLSGSFSPPMDSGLSTATLSSVGVFLAARAEVAWRLCSTNVITGWREFFGEPFPS